MTKKSFEFKRYSISLKVDIPEKLNTELENDIKKQIDVTFKKDPTDKPRTKPGK